MHARASKRKAVSYKRLLELDIASFKKAEVEDLFTRAEQSEAAGYGDRWAGGAEEIARRQDRLMRLAEAKRISRAQERTAGPSRPTMRKPGWRTCGARAHDGRRPRGRPPTPPVRGPRDGDQYNFTDPESRIMKIDECRVGGGLQRAGGRGSGESTDRGDGASNHPTIVRKPTPRCEDSIGDRQPAAAGVCTLATLACDAGGV